MEIFGNSRPCCLKFFKIKKPECFSAPATLSGYILNDYLTTILLQFLCHNKLQKTNFYHLRANF